MKAICLRIMTILILLCCTAGAALADWNTAVMVKPDYLARFKPHRSIAWDPTQSEFVAAYGGDQLYVARGAANQWTIEVVDDTRGAGEATSLVVTTAGAVHISYYIFETRSLWYAKNEGTGWELELVMDSDDSGRYNSLAVDADGTAYIALSHVDGSSQQTLRVIDNADGVWDDYYVADPTVGCGYSNSIGLNAAGYPAVAYYCSLPKAANYELRYAEFDGAVFSHLTLDTDAGFGASLAFDATGHPHVAYGKGTDLYLATDDGGGWVTGAVDDTARRVGGQNQVIFDAGVLNILTTDTGSRDFLLYTYNGSVWSEQVLDTLPSGTQWKITGAFDDSGDLTVMYLDTYVDVGSLTVLYPLAKAWDDFELVSYVGVGDAPALALDEDGWPQAASFGGYDAYYTAWDGGAWFSELMEDMLWFYTLGIAMNDENQPVVAHENWGGELILSTLTPTGWDDEVITTPETVGDAAMVRFGVDGAVHVMFTDNNHELNYGYRTGATTWAFEQVNPGGNTWMNIDFAVGSDDAIWAVYSDYMTNDLAIAYRDPVGGLWSITPFSGAGSLGGGNAVVLNDLGLPRILYTDTTGDTLRLKYDDGSKAWLDVPLANNSAVSHHIGLALDATGGLHFSYFNKVDFEMTYGYMDSVTAPPTFTTIDTFPTNLTADSDLTLDAQDRPVIAYEAPQYGRLMLAADLPLPSLTSITPNEGDAGATVTAEIAGVELFAASAVWLAAGTDRIDCTDIDNPDREVVVCDLDLTGATPGTYDLHVTVANGEAMLADAFEALATGDDDDDTTGDDDDDNDDADDDDDTDGDDDDNDDDNDNDDDDDDDDDGCCGCGC
jgi:hypothetical protein